MTLGEEVSYKREQLKNIIRQQIARVNDGASILYSVPVGLGKTKTMLNTVNEKMQLRQECGAVLFTWYSVEQLHDAINGGFPGLYIYAPRVNMPEGWQLGDELPEINAVAAIVQRGKSQDGMCRQPPNTPCHTCMYQRGCPYTWQKAILKTGRVKVIFSTHAV